MRYHEVQGIMRLAQTYLLLERKLLDERRRARDAASGKPTMRKSVSMSDTDGLKALFAGQGSRPKPATKAPPRSSSHK